ncbi:MAG: DUF6538 domain-containing protein [Brucella sp.]
MRKVRYDTKGLYLRNNTYYYRRSIPEGLRVLAGKREYFLSLRTSDIDNAFQQLISVRKHISELIQSMWDGNFDQSRHATSDIRRITSFVDVAEHHAANSQIATKLPELAKAVLVNPQAAGSEVNRDKTPIAELLRVYLDANAYLLRSDNAREYARKIKPLENALRKLDEFIDFDCFIEDITPDIAISFRRYLRDIVTKGDITDNTANKYLIHLRKLFRTYYEENNIIRDTPFKNVNLKEERRQRVPMTVGFIKANWISNPIFDRLNDELRHILWVMIDTGCNFKELGGLDPDDIKLNDTIPHIILRPNRHRKLKTAFRERNIPLVGLALSALKKHPEGFPRYRDANGPTNASAALNKFLKQNNLFEKDGQSVYSVRHCFKDRLRNHGITGEMQDYLMGHQTPGMGAHYGNGYDLKKVHEAMLRLGNDL